MAGLLKLVPMTGFVRSELCERQNSELRERHQFRLSCTKAQMRRGKDEA